jgi:hypothetical protein
MEPLYERKTGFGRNSTVCFAWKGGPLLWLQFHSTVVARFDYEQRHLDEYRSRTAGGALTVPDRLKPFVVHLNNGGWATPTTRERINRALGMVGLSLVHLIVRKHQEYIVYGAWGSRQQFFAEFNGKISFADTEPETLPIEGTLPWVVKYRPLFLGRERETQDTVTSTIVVNTRNKPSAMLYARATHLTNGEKIVGVSKF